MRGGFPSLLGKGGVWLTYGGGRGGGGLSSAINMNGDRERLRRLRECCGDLERDLDRERGLSSEYKRLLQENVNNLTMQKKQKKQKKNPCLHYRMEAKSRRQLSEFCSLKTVKFVVERTNVQ